MASRPTKPTKLRLTPPATGKPPWMSQALWTHLKTDYGRGQRHDFIYWAFWLDLPPRDWPWVEALDELDRLRDKKPLQRLLKSDCELSPKMRRYLADLIERRCVPLPKGRRHTPIYTITEKEVRHCFAHWDVADNRKLGMSLDDAIKKAANRFHLNTTSLRLSLEGRHTSLRKSMKK
jgi:hypothetical protein